MGGCEIMLNEKLVECGAQLTKLIMEIETKIDDDEKFLEFMVKTNKYFTNIIRRMQNNE